MTRTTGYENEASSRDVHEVARGDELGTAGHRVTVNLRDHRFGEIPNSEPAVGDVARPVPSAARGVVRPGLVAALQVVARGETLTRAAHDRHVRARVGIGGFERVEEFGAHSVVDRVPLLGPVERDAPNLLRRVVDRDELVGHRVPARSAINSTASSWPVWIVSPVKPHSVHGRNRSLMRAGVPMRPPSSM